MTTEDGTDPELPETVFAPAKLTISLRITGVRDDGYHLIDAEMVTIDLQDRLEIDPLGEGIRVSGPYSNGVPTDDRNLIAGALRLAGRTAGVHVHKAIPHGGGLGGGSTDAAAVLRWAGFDDVVKAAKLGADIPFCLRGGRARVRGIGERITALSAVDRQYTLVVPPIEVSTPAVYRAWDTLGGPSGPGVNDLEVAAIEVEPRLARWRDRIRECCDRRPTLAGSGATWFVEGEHSDALAVLDDEGAQVIVTRTVPATR